MSQTDRFLYLAGHALIQQEGLRLVKAPPRHAEDIGWSPGWGEWDEVLVGDGPGVRPAIYVLKVVRDPHAPEIRAMYHEIVQRMASGQNVQVGQGSSLPLRLVVIYCFNSIDPRAARQLSQLVPDRYYANLKPEVWVADVSGGHLWAPKSFGFVPSRAQNAVKQALELTDRGDVNIDEFDLARAEASASSQRFAFVSVMRHNVPYVTYALLAAIWLVFLLESLAPRGSMAARTLLEFGAMQPRLVEHGEWWLLFTEMFVHVGFVHILFNSIALYSIGTIVERIYGALRYAIIYFVSGLFASLASYIYLDLTGQSNEIAAGASGAIFGIAGMVIVLGVLRQSLVPRSVALQLSVFMGVLIVMNLAFDVVSPEIDIRAHIGGLVMGLILGYFLAPRTTTAKVSQQQEMVG